MEITLKIEGMKCAHCSGRVKKALEKIDGIKAEINHENGIAVISSDGEIDVEAIKDIIDEYGFDVAE